MPSALIPVLKVATSLGSTAMYLSPAINMRRVIKTKSTGETQLIPLVCMLNNCHLWTIYGLFIGDLYPVASTCFFGWVCALVYTVTFCCITSDRQAAMSTCALACIPIGLVSLFAGLAWMGVTGQSNHDAGTALGFVGLATSFVFYASPFVTIRTVLRTKSAATIPIHMVSMATASTTLWSVYAILQSDVFVFIPNAVCFCLSLSQVLLFIHYNPNRLTSDGAAEEFAVSAGPKERASPSFQAALTPV